MIEADGRETKRLRRENRRLKKKVEMLGSDDSAGRDYILTDAQMQDVAHINAVNAAILQQAFRLALSIREDTGLSLDEAFSTELFKEKIDLFLKGYLTRFETDRSLPPRQTAFDIMNEILG